MIVLKTQSEIEIMAKGGKILGEILEKVVEKVKPGISTLDLNQYADLLINNYQGLASFKTVKNYHWATCICINDVVVHGIPKNEEKIKDGDIVGIDIGLLYKGFHTDMSTSLIAGYSTDKKRKRFLETGKNTLDKAIEAIHQDGFIGDISKIIQTMIEEEGYNIVKELVGHGVGKNLHEDPQIPGWLPKTKKPEETGKLRVGMVLAIEIIYVLGKADIIYGNDGWTIKTLDGSPAGLFEKTVAVTKTGPKVLTPFKDKVL